MAPLALTFGMLNSGLSTVSVGAVLAAEMVPAALLMLAGGVAADMFSRRNVMIASELLSCASQAASAYLMHQDHPLVQQLIVPALCAGMATALYIACVAGFLLDVVGVGHIGAANGLFGITISICSLMAPFLAGLLVQFAGPSLALAVDAGSYAFSALCLSFIPPPQRRCRDEGAASFLQELRMGWAEFRRHRWLHLLTIQGALLNLLAITPLYLLGPTLFASQQAGVQKWSFIVCSIGVGGIVGGALMLHWRPSRPLVVLQFALLGLAFQTGLLAAVTSLIFLIVGGAIFGAAITVVSIVSWTVLQEHIPEALLSRVDSISSLGPLAAMPLSFIIVGAAAQLFGIRQSLGVCAALLAILALSSLSLQETRSFARREDASTTTT
jgi:MFS family permease